MTDVAGSQPAIKSHIRLIAILCGALVLGIGGWAALTRTSGAVISQGFLVSESYSKKIQHPTGGVVRKVFVTEGQLVKAGDLLVQLDETQVRAGLDMTNSDLLLLDARDRRLKAEEALATGHPDPSLLAPSGQSPALAEQLASERRLLEARRLLRDRQKAQLEAQIAGQQKQIEGLHTMAESRDRQIGLTNDELTGVQALYDQGYAPISTLKSLQREAETLHGEEGQIKENAAEASNKIAELRMQALEIDAQHLQQVMTDLRDDETRRGELLQKQIAQTDELNHMAIRSPQNGYVHELAIHTVGGVVGAGEPLMMIVPANDALAVEARVDPRSITEIHIGQKATVKFVGLNPRTNPDLNGTVGEISPDLIQDPKTGASYYTVRITLPPDQVARLGDVKLVPGMPAQTFIKTGDRSVLSYILTPLQDQLSVTFREH
jgi:HlyD family secretion protein